MIDLLNTYYELPEGDSSLLSKRLWTRPKIKTGKKEEEICDAIIAGTNSAILIECKAMAFNETVLTESNAINVMHRLEKILFSKSGAITQLDTCVNKLRDGALSFEGFNKNDFDIFRPVVVLYFSLPHAELLLSWVREQAEVHGLLQQKGLAPLEILSFRDLEMVGALIEQGHSFEELLQKKGELSQSEGEMFTIYLHKLMLLSEIHRAENTINYPAVDYLWHQAVKQKSKAPCLSETEILQWLYFMQGPI